MNPLQLLLLGLVAGLGYGVVIFVAMLLFGRHARAPRIAFAGVISGAIALFLTALIEGPFYPHARTLADMAEPLGVAAIAGGGAAIMGVLLLVRLPPG